MAVSPSVTEELTCSICLELFDQPVLLPCAHTFCRQCLKDFCVRNQEVKADDKDAENILCPKCRIRVKLGKNGVDDLPKNTTLANIILSFEEDGQRPKFCPCDVCDVNPPRTGFKSCSECNLTYCRTCFSQLHPMRGAFVHHVITTPAQSDMEIRSPRLSIRKLHRVRSLSPPKREQEYMEKIRKSIFSKRKELREVLKTAQDLLKTTEDDTENQMKQIKNLSSRLHEAVAEREGAMLAECTRRRHETFACCYGLISDAQAQILELDLLDEKFGQLLMRAPILDISSELSALEERLAVLSSILLSGRLDDMPRQRQLQEMNIPAVLRDMDFLQETDTPPPTITDILPRPVSKGPAVIDVKWAGSVEGVTYRVTAWRKTQKGRTERIIVDDITGGSHMLLLPGVDAQYRLIVTAIGKPNAGELITAEGEIVNTGLEAASAEKIFRTLPYVNCISLRFDAAYCHKQIAVTSSKEAVMHRKCRLANLQDVLPTATLRRLDTLEGALADNPLPPLPNMYWEIIIHFHVISKLDNSKLICDLGVCKVGMEDICGLVCDNHKSYCCYLVKRNRYISLEFWNGPNQAILGRSLTVADLERENEKTLRLGFYLDMPRHLFAVVNPVASSILAQFHVKFTSLVFLCGLYCPDQVYATIKHNVVTNIPSVVARLMKGQAEEYVGVARQ